MRIGVSPNYSPHYTSQYLHVNPAVECFVYSPLHMARGGAKYYSWTLPSLKTDPQFLSLSSPIVFTSQF